MRFVVLGSNGTYPTPGRPASGYLVVGKAGTVLVDCGPGVFPALLERDVIPDAIVLSHVHGDHCLDVVPLFNHLRFDRPDLRDIPLLAPSGAVDRLARFIGAGTDHDFFRVFTSHEPAAGSTVHLVDLEFTFGVAAHPVPAFITRVADGTASLTYSGDTGPGGDLTRMATGSDLLVSEATHQGEPPHDRYPYHLHAVEAGRVASEAGVGQLVVTHVAPTLDPARSVAEAAAVFEGPVMHAEPGLEIEL